MKQKLWLKTRTNVQEGIESCDLVRPTRQPMMGLIQLFELYLLMKVLVQIHPSFL